jgi:uncharacterized metal-binding protein YceD (DUF177 family)
MEESFKISLDLLKDGQSCPIKETFSPEFLDVQEEELLFQEKVHVQGQASLIEDHILLELTVKCSAKLPCSICNQWTQVAIYLPQILISEEIENRNSRFFDYKEALREAILLEVPQFAECQGSCPERKNMESYCQRTKESKSSDYFPFEQLK